jgi:putative ABC transport system permease protein
MIGMVSLSGLRYIYEARLATRAVVLQEVFAILGIAVGVALFFASQVSSTSLDRGVPQLNNRLVGSAQVQLKARSYEGFPETALNEVRHIPGIESALPILERQVNVIGRHGERPVLLIGVEPKAMRLTSRFDREFSSKQLAHINAIALPAPLAHDIGEGGVESVRIQVGAQFTRSYLGATLNAYEIGPVVQSPVAVATIQYAQRLTRAPGTLTRIVVHYRPSHAREARSALAGIARKWRVNFTPSTFESRLFAVAVAPEDTSERLFSGISALVGLLFAVNAMLVTVPSRRKLVEDLYPHGYTRLMTVQILLVNAVVLGALACGLGLILGDALSIFVFDVTPGYLTFAFPVGSQRIIDWQTVTFAAVLAMGTAVIGVLVPLSEAFLGPREKSFKQDRSRSWLPAAALGTAVLCLAITTYTLVWNTREALIGNIALVVALGCVLPFAFKLAVRLFARLSDWMNDLGSGFAASELESPPARIRYLAIAGTAAVAVFAAVEFGGTQANLIRGLDASIRDMDASANLWVVPSGGSSLQTTVPFQPVNTRQLATLSGVRSVSAYRGSFLDWGEHRAWVIAPGPNVDRPIPASELLTGSSTTAAAQVKGGGWAVLSAGLAREHHLRIGEPFVLPAPRPIRLRLAGTTTNLGWPPGTIILNAANYAAAWGSTVPSAYEIQTSAPPSEVRPRVLAALHGLGLSVQTSSEREALHYAAARQGLSRLTQIRILILVAAILAVIAAMTAMIYSRREEIATTKCHGISEGPLWWSLMWESSVVLIAGSSIGVVLGLYAQLLGSHFLSTVTGFPIVFSLELMAAIFSFGLVTALTVLALAIPGLRVVRVPASTVSPAH